MKKINFAAIEGELSREEMKHIMAGSGYCRVYSTESSNGWTGWSDCTFDEDQAKNWYNSYSSMTGWCCASCDDMCY